MDPETELDVRKDGWKAAFLYIIKQLFNQKVIIYIIGAMVTVTTAWFAWKQTGISDKVDKASLQQDTISKKQVVAQQYDSTYRKRNDARWNRVDSSFNAIFTILKTKK